jgi:hypothetical protein
MGRVGGKDEGIALAPQPPHPSPCRVPRPGGVVKGARDWDPEGPDPGRLGKKKGSLFCPAGMHKPSWQHWTTEDDVPIP